MFEVTEQDGDCETLKLITKKVLEDFNMLELERDNENLFFARINDENGFYSILTLFFSLYLLEKLYSQRYPISVEGLENRELKKELKRNLRSIIPKHSQAYFLNFDGRVVFVTYFGYHDEHVNVFGKSRILAGDFVKLFESIYRPKYVKTPSDCPIILAFKYHIAERFHIIEDMECEVSIEFNELRCDRSNNECSCLKIIEKAIIEDSKNRDCNLRILGGAQIFFDIDYELVKRLISFEGPEGETPNDTLKKRGYEPIFNFLLGCYLSDKLKVKFNSNIKLKFNGIEKEVDIILFPKTGVTIIETTREHDVCTKDEYFEKLEKSILKCILTHTSTAENGLKLKFLLITLTPESKFTKCTHYLTFARSLFNFEHVGIPDEEEVIKFIKETKYFSPKNTQKILEYQLNKLIDSLNEN